MEMVKNLIGLQTVFADSTTEMNIHICQNEEARAELQGKSNVDYNWLIDRSVCRVDASQSTHYYSWKFKAMSWARARLHELDVLSYG